MTENEKPDLQFDQEEFETAETTAQASCASCSAALTDVYFDVNGHPLCEPCKNTFENSFRGGSGMTRLMKATLFGVIAAIVGAMIYFAILKFTGYEVGLVAILVGFMVGKAVIVGSGGRGGAVYQFIAVSLTYLAIVSTYAPFIFEGLSDYDETEIAMQQSELGNEYENVSGNSALADGQAGTIEDYGSKPMGEDDLQLAAGESFEEVGFGEMAMGVLMLIGILLASPFLAGFENIIGLLIIGFGLFQAWALTKKTELSISGPYQIQSSED